MSVIIPHTSFSAWQVVLASLIARLQRAGFPPRRKQRGFQPRFHEAGAKTHVCDIQDPNLIGRLRHPAADQIREATKAMLAIGRAPLAWATMAQQAQLT
jgi:hypothetical protein